MKAFGGAGSRAVRDVAGLPLVNGKGIPAVTRSQMAEVDRIAVEEFGLGLLQMMENAGLWLAETVRRFLDGSVAGRRVVIASGKGNNGGGGLAAARRLSIWGSAVTVLLIQPPESLAPGPAAQLRILQRSGTPVQPFNGTLPPHDLLVDALVGYNLRGALSGVLAATVEAMNDSPAGVVALDLPSGVDADTGTAQGAAIRATATVTLALPKSGLLAEPGREYVGQLLLADIGIPQDAYRLASIAVPAGVFSRGPLVRLQTQM